MEIDIWEMYGIHSKLPHEIQVLGKWNEKDGIMIQETRKWIRRTDLKVKPALNRKRFLKSQYKMNFSDKCKYVIHIPRV